MNDDEALVAMVDSNLQREKIRISEKAFAYRMKYDVVKREGKHPKEYFYGEKYHGMKTIEFMGKEQKDSPKQVQCRSVRTGISRSPQTGTSTQAGQATGRHSLRYKPETVLNKLEPLFILFLQEETPAGLPPTSEPRFFGSGVFFWLSMR